jgi:hypothetical protein
VALLVPDPGREQLGDAVVRLGTAARTRHPTPGRQVDVDAVEAHKPARRTLRDVPVGEVPVRVGEAGDPRCDAERGHAIELLVVVEVVGDADPTHQALRFAIARTAPSVSPSASPMLALDRPSVLGEGDGGRTVALGCVEPLSGDIQPCQNFFPLDGILLYSHKTRSSLLSPTEGEKAGIRFLLRVPVFAFPPPVILFADPS